MPTYDYRCKSGHVFEDMKPVADREHSVCECGELADQVILRGPMIDQNKMGLDPGFPSAFARKGEGFKRRARGTDKTVMNKQVTDEATDRTAHEMRVRLGESKVTSVGKSN